MKVKRKIGDLGKDQIRQLIEDFLDELDEGAVALLEHFEESESPEFMAVELDEDGKILSFTSKDGSHYVCNLKSETLDALAERIGVLEEQGGLDNFENVEDPIGRVEVVKDSNEKVVSYRDSKGILHENAGIETPEINLSKAGLNKLSEELEIPLPETIGLYKSPNLPKHGTTNIKTETFYLTAVPGFNSISQCTITQDFEDTVANAMDRMTLYHYYFGATRLRHYAAGKVKLNASDNKYYAKETIRKIGNVWYYADTLGYTGTTTERSKVIDGYSEVYTGSDIPVSGNYGTVQTEVVQCSAAANVNTWTVEDWDFNAVEGTDIGKKYEHWCIADIDFGHYLNKTDAAIGVKYQGNSTQSYRKRNFRYTFYKNNTFAKKDKVKIGEMLRLSKFNLKANWVDPTRIKELILYRLFTAIWQNRPITDRYDWDNTVNGLYHGVTGNIIGFPIALSVNDNFYGLYMFGLPKDGKNYFIDDKDEDTGLFVSGAHNTANDWGVTLPYVLKDHYDSEMDSDDLADYPAIEHALTEWTHFINGRLYNGSDGNTYNSTELTEVDGTMYVTSTLDDGQVTADSVSAVLIPFDRENIPGRLDVIGFMDYFICMQMFVMCDSTHNNVILYSGAEKKKMFPFFYDLDATINEYRTGGAECDILAEGVSYSSDVSLWENFKEEYWDDIVNRYCELRKTYLSLDYIRSVYEDIAKNIPDTDFIGESSKWGLTVNADSFDSKMTFIEQRIEWLDESYFKV